LHRRFARAALLAAACPEDTIADLRRIASEAGIAWTL
jgi:hypothetical protein